MASTGIVASTLRRRTMRQKMTVEARYQALEPGHISLSPTAPRPPMRSPSMSRVLSRSPSGASGARAAKGHKLGYEDFWPKCLNPMEQNIRMATFDSFDTLIPKANSWLAENLDIRLIKCETLEKKVSSIHEVGDDNCMFTPKGSTAIYVKGLRLWFVHDTGEEPKSHGVVAQRHPLEVGYMNVIPRCLDSTGKYPVYENLQETYDAVNAYLETNPLEGEILTVESVPVKLPRRLWQGPEVDPDRTYWPDDYLRHILYITRIYFVYGEPHQEFIGAEDFMPEFLEVPRWYSVYGAYPKYTSYVSAMHKVKTWMQEVQNLRVTNLQTLEAVFPGNPDRVNTGLNFINKIESCTTVRFVRVSFVYVDPPDGEEIDTKRYSPPHDISYKTFIPSAIKVGLCSGAPQYEPNSDTWARARAWLKLIGDRHVIYAEQIYHPLNRIWHHQDSGESSVMQGEWTAADRGDRRRKSRKPLVQIIRIYLDGDYVEPPLNHLPPAPLVEEVNDCRCVIQ